MNIVTMYRIIAMIAEWKIIFFSLAFSFDS